MERKLEESEKHIAFLYDELELKEKEIDSLKESVDHANEICRKNTAYAQEILVEKCSISLELEKKENEINDLRKKRGSECKNGCEKYSKSEDDIYEATNKHREKLVALKEISEGQKSKIYVSENTEMNSLIE